MQVFSRAFRNGLPQDNPLPALILAPNWREFEVYGKQVWAPVTCECGPRRRRASRSARLSISL